MHGNHHSTQARTLNTTKMATPWTQTAQEKRRLRDEAIQRVQPLLQDVNGTANPTAATRDPSAIDNVDGILRAVSSGAVTATGLCTAFICR